VAPYCEGMARALDHEDARVVAVGKADWMYQTIQEGVTAAAALSPSASSRAVVWINPGYYDMTEGVDVSQYIEIRGVSKHVVQLHNATTDMFRVTGPSVFFNDFLIEGAAAPSLYVFNGNNQDRMHVRNVDMLMNSGASTQKFLKQVGSTWTNMFIEHCVIDSYTTSSYLVLLTNSSGAARMVDCQLNDVSIDTYHLTNYGGGVLIRDCQDVRIGNCREIRGQATYHTGVRIERQVGTTGTPRVDIRHSYLYGGVPVYGAANTDYWLVNTEAVGAATAGTRTVHNSTV
jgi:hypothetical protein